jgi:hypothetical protein
MLQLFMDKMKFQYKLFLVLIVITAISIIALIANIQRLEHSSTSNNPSLIVSLRTGCGLSCFNAGTIEVYSNRTYSLFKGIEEKSTSETSGNIPDDVYLKLLENIQNIPSSDSFETDNVQGADMIESFLYVYDLNGGQKEYPVGDMTSASKNEVIIEILQLLTNLK